MLFDLGRQSSSTSAEIEGRDHRKVGEPAIPRDQERVRSVRLVRVSHATKAARPRCRSRAFPKGPDAPDEQVTEATRVKNGSGSLRASRANAISEREATKLR